MTAVSSPGDIFDATGALVVKGARVPAGAVSGYVLTSDANGNLSLQPSTGGGGAVSSVFGRAGTVTAQSGDYTAAQVGALPKSGGAMTGWLSPAVVALTDASTIAVSAALGNDFRVTLGGSRTMGAPSNPADGQEITFVITQPGSGGPWTVTWAAAYQFGTAGAPPMSTAANAVDIFSFKYDLALTEWLFTGAITQAVSVVPLTQGGTGQVTAQAAVNALLAAVTSGFYARGNGTNVVMSAIQAADVPTLNQSTTGNAATATNLAGGATLPDYLAPAVVALTFGSSIAVNAGLGNAFNLTLTASTGTIANPSNPADGQVIRFRISQDGTGSRTVAWGTAYDFGAAGAPTLSTAASKVDIVAFEYVASISKWACLGSGLGY